jgi:hypothetical protein
MTNHYNPPYESGVHALLAAEHYDLILALAAEHRATTQPATRPPQPRRGTIVKLFVAVHTQHPGAWLPLAELADRKDRSYNSIRNTITTLRNRGTLQTFTTTIDGRRCQLIRLAHDDHRHLPPNPQPITINHNGNTHRAYQLDANN